MNTTNGLTKQSVLDATPSSNNEAILQNMLHLFSKTRLEQLLRMLNELDSKALYKTQWRTIPFNEVHDAIKIAIQLEKNESLNE